MGIWLDYLVVRLFVGFTDCLTLVWDSVVDLVFVVFVSVYVCLTCLVVDNCCVFLGVVLCLVVVY